MGQVRSWDFDAVIGVGGISAEPSLHGIDGKINWVGIGAHKTECPRARGPIVSFDHFVLYESAGPSFDETAPRLAKRLYDKNVRVLLHDMSPIEILEVERILQLARHAPSSAPVTKQVVRRCERRHCSCGRCHDCHRKPRHC